MLQVMRDLAKSWIFKGLMLLLVISFAAWGIGDMFKGNPQARRVAQAGGETITRQDLEAQFKVNLVQARQTLGPDLTESRARQEGLLDNTLDELVERAVFNQEIRRLGLNVGDAYIFTRLMTQKPELRGKDGKFDLQLWRQAISKGGFSERYVLDQEREQVARSLVLGLLTKDRAPPQTLVDNLYKARGNKFIVEILTLHDDHIDPPAAPDESTLRAYYQAHSAQFVAPEYRRMTLVRLSAQDVAKDVVIRDEDLRKVYDARSAELTEPERRDMIQVVLQDELKAKELAEEAKTSKNLTQAAKAKGLSIVTVNGIDEKGVLPELYTTVFAVPVGTITAPVKSGLGWHVIELRKIHPGGKPTFESFKENGRETLRQEQAADLVAKRVNQMDDDLAASKALEDITDALKLQLVKIPALDAKGLTPEGKAPTDILAKTEVLKHAFGQSAGETSAVIDDHDGNYIVVRTDDVTPSQAPPFEKIQAKVKAAWQAEQQGKQAAEKIEEIASALRDGKRAATFATEAGVDVRLSKPISQLGDTDKNLPATVMPQILKMNRDDVITTAAEGKHYALRLTDVVPVDPAKSNNARNKILGALKRELQPELLYEYVAHLHQRYPVAIDKAFLETLKKQGAEGK